MPNYKGGATIVGDNGKEIPEIDSEKRPVEESFMMILGVLCDIYKTEVRTMPPVMNTYVKKHLDFIAEHLATMAVLNEKTFDKEGFKKFVIDMCNKLYNFNEKEKLMTGGVRSPPQWNRSMVQSKRTGSSRRRSQTKELLNSWFVQCIILISLFGSIFCAYIAYVKFNHLVSTMTQTGTVFEITNFVQELDQGIGDGFAVYIWKTFTNDYDLINNYYTTTYKDMMGKYLASSMSAISEKANKICIGSDVFVEGNAMIQSGEFMNIVNKIVSAVTSVMSFKDTGNCVSNTVKLLTLQEIDRMKTVLSLKFEEINTHNNQIWLYLQYAGFLAWPAMLYYPRLFMRVGKKMMSQIRNRADLHEEAHDEEDDKEDDEDDDDDVSPRNLRLPPPADQFDEGHSDDDAASPDSQALVPRQNPNGGRKSKARRLYRNRRVVTMKKKRKMRRSIRKN